MQNRKVTQVQDKEIMQGAKDQDLIQKQDLIYKQASKDFIHKQVANINKIILMVIMFSHAASYAGIEKLIKNVMPQGTMSNVSKGAIVKDQLAGHLVGGSVLMRLPSTDDLQLVNFQAPKCSLGGLPCAAQFDLRGGALSIINSAEMMRFLKNMVQNAGAYGGIMAIKTICPQCENIMTWLEGVQRSVNQFSSMSCNDMMGKVHGMYAKVGLTGEANRQSNLVMTSGGKDMTEIADKARKSKDDPTQTNEQLKGQLGENFNLVWKALDKKAAGSGDGRSLKELLMSISGTVIMEKDTPPKNLRSLASKELIEEYIGKGSGSANIELYSCNETERCLNPKIVKTTLKADDTLYGQIDKLLSKMVEKIAANKGDFTEDEENLIALSSLPLVLKIQTDLGTYADSANITVRMAEFVEALCYDVVTTHLSKLLRQTSAAVDELSYLQIAEVAEIFNKFNGQITDVLRFLSDSKSMAFKRLDTITRTKLQMQQQERDFERRFEEHLQLNELELNNQEG